MTFGVSVRSMQSSLFKQNYDESFISLIYNVNLSLISAFSFVFSFAFFFCIFNHSFLCLASAFLY